MAIVLQESLRALFYAPFYAALALDAYAQEGVEVAFASAPTPGQAASGLFDGSVDVVWGGPMRVMQTYERRPDCGLVCFGEAVTRDPFLLVGREPNPEFRPADLLGRRVATVAEVPTPWLCLQEDLRRAGLDPGALTRVADRGMADNAAALRRGEVDVVQVFEPLAETLIAAGAGHLWYAAAARGPTSYTTFYTRRGILAEKREPLRRMVRALYRTQRWLHAQGPAALAAVVRPYFAELPPALLDAAVARYTALGIWGRDPILPRAGYDRLKAGLVSGGFVSGTPFEIAVDNSLAEAAVRDDPPALAQ